MGEKAGSTGVKPAIYRFGYLIKRLPFTLCMIIILLVVAWWTNSAMQALTHAWISRLGFAPRDLWFLRWERLILSAFVTSGGVTFWLAMAMVAFSSGIAEWMRGSLRAILVFWGVHLATLVSESLIFALPLHRLGFTQARGLFFSRDVGPSAGYMGSLGFITYLLPKPWRWVAGGVILAYLVVAVVIPSSAGTTPAIELTDDLAHLIAFPLGWLAASLLGRKRARDFSEDNMSDKPISQKLSFKTGTKFLLVNPPNGYVAMLGELPPGVSMVDTESGLVEAIQVFVSNRGELETQLPKLKQRMAPKGMLWVTYHKGTSKVKTDINRDTIAAYARTIGLQPVALISIDEDWAALRLKLTG